MISNEPHFLICWDFVPHGLQLLLCKMFFQAYYYWHDVLSRVNSSPHTYFVVDQQRNVTTM